MSASITLNAANLVLQQISLEQKSWTVEQGHYYYITELQFAIVLIRKKSTVIQEYNKRKNKPTDGLTNTVR